MYHKCGNFYFHPHSLTTMSSNFFWTALLFLSKRRTDIGPRSSSKVMKSEPLGNFLRCVEEHLPLHDMEARRCDDDKPRSLKYTYMRTIWYVSFSCSCMLMAYIMYISYHISSWHISCSCMLMAYIFWPGDSDMVLFVSKDGGFLRLFSTCSFLIAHGVKRRRWETKSDRNRYSVVIMFTTNFNSEDWVLVSNITTKLFQRQKNSHKFRTTSGVT